MNILIMIAAFSVNVKMCYIIVYIILCIQYTYKSFYNYSNNFVSNFMYTYMNLFIIELRTFMLYLLTHLQRNKTEKNRNLFYTLKSILY